MCPAPEFRRFRTLAEASNFTATLSSMTCMLLATATMHTHIYIMLLIWILLPWMLITRPHVSNLHLMTSMARPYRMRCLILWTITLGIIAVYFILCYFPLAQRPSNRQQAVCTLEQLHESEKLFAVNKYPNLSTRERLAARFNIAKSHIQVWYTNRCAKFRNVQRYRWSDDASSK